MRRAQPLLAAASLADTCACVGASLASNIATARSPVGAVALLPVRARPSPRAPRLEWHRPNLQDKKCWLVVHGCDDAPPCVCAYDDDDDCKLNAHRPNPDPIALRITPLKGRLARRSQVLLFHAMAFYIGHRLAAATVARGCLARARAISLTTGMQVGR